MALDIRDPKLPVNLFQLSAAITLGVLGTYGRITPSIYQFLVSVEARLYTIEVLRSPWAINQLQLAGTDVREDQEVTVTNMILSSIFEVLYAIFQNPPGALK